MPTLRTLPQALRDAAGSGHGCLFIGAGSTDQHAGVYRTYADLHAAALAVSRALHRMGLRRGDVVALALDDAEAFLTALYGASMAGALPASLHPPGTTRDLDSVLRSHGRGIGGVRRPRAVDERTRRGLIRSRAARMSEAGVRHAV